tara:strand:- start:280 stop:2178 length:1899 start_codon:yes stop_codon:yes gene_type:complete
MCGINGLIFFDKIPAFDPFKIIKKMNDSLAHRGPDYNGFWNKNNVFLGHRRLSIIDLSEKSNQPMQIDNHVLTFNGEIYNYIELRLFLQKKGFEFKSSGDTEVLINAYKFFGSDVCKHLNGMFSFAIFDIKKNKIFFARDPSGQKPLYFFKNEKVFLFSSELKSIIQTNLDNFKLDEKAMNQYLAYGHTISPNSMIKNLKKLEPGCYLELELNKKSLKKKRFFNFKFDIKTNKSLNYFNDKFSQIFANSIKRHFRSDVPSAVYLSSGIDSTSILSELSNNFKKQRINTITAKFEESDYDESIYAKKVSDIFGTNHTEFKISKNDIFESIFKILDQIDEPISDLGLIAIHQVAKCAKGNYKVVFSGDGGDELFFGYEPFMKYPFTYVLDFLPPFIIKKIHYFLSKIDDDFGYLGLRYKIRLFLNSYKNKNYKKNQSWSGSFELQNIINLINKDISMKSIEDEIFSKTKKIFDNTEISDLKKLGLEYYNLFLPEIICSHTDKANMMESIEARSPFLDNEMINLSMEIPDKYKVNIFRGKIIMRENLKKFKNLDFIFNKKKKGYTIPMSKYFLKKNDLTDFFLDTLSNKNNPNLFNYDFVRKLFKLHYEKKTNYGKELWNFLMLDNWLTNNKITI